MPCMQAVPTDPICVPNFEWTSSLAVCAAQSLWLDEAGLSCTLHIQVFWIQDADNWWLCRTCIDSHACSVLPTQELHKEPPAALCRPALGQGPRAGPVSGQFRPALELQLSQVCTPSTSLQACCHVSFVGIHNVPAACCLCRLPREQLQETLLEIWKHIHAFAICWSD